MTDGGSILKELNKFNHAVGDLEETYLDLVSFDST